jgi:hypothetical protein
MCTRSLAIRRRSLRNVTNKEKNRYTALDLGYVVVEISKTPKKEKKNTKKKTTTMQKQKQKQKKDREFTKTSSSRNELRRLILRI